MTSVRNARKRANGEGSIYQRKDGYWIAATTYHGKTYTFSGKQRSDAISKRKQWLRDRERGISISAGQWLFNDWLDHALDRKRPQYDATGHQEQGIEPTTFGKYETNLRLHTRPFFATPPVPLTGVTADLIERWQAGLADAGRSAEVRKQALTFVSQALKLATQRRLIPFNPADASQIERPRIRAPRPVKTSEDDIGRLLRTIRGDRLEILVWLALGAGLRRSEVAGLLWADIQYDGPSAVIHAHARVNRLTRRTADMLGLQSSRLERSGLKAEDERFVPVASLVVDALQRHRKQQLGERLTGFVATTSIGTAIEPDTISKYLAEVRDRAGLQTRTFHQLRHAFVTFLERLGATEHTRMAMAGHKTSAMSTHYTHVMDPAKVKAANDLDGFLQGLLDTPRTVATTVVINPDS